jgi:hypothetical protein
MKTVFYLFILLTGFQIRLQAQIFDKPSLSLTSHPTLDIMSIEKWEDQTVMNIRIKNQRISGSFCIDRETYLLNSLGTHEWRMVSMDGIPACPDQYRFKSIGETLEFSLVFPPIPDDVKYIDLLEKCEDACVSVRYILLDEEMNSRIDEGFRLYELGRLSASLQVFEDIMQAGFDDHSPVYGTIYLYMMSIQYELGRSKEVKRIFNELKASSIIGKEDFIEAAHDSGLVR